MNRVKDLLRAGEVVVGTTAGVGSEVRFLANSGFDFLLFDTQHSPDELKQLGAPLAAMRRREAIPIVRVGDLRPDQICYALDAGAKGVIVPMVNTKAQMLDMIKWCKYPFEGERSSAGVRGEWGEYDSYRDYMDAVNEQLLIIPMIETVEAMDNLTDILSVPGIDVLLIGPSDLSINLDVPLDYENPKYHDALDTIAAACKAADVVPGVFFVPPGIAPAQLIEKGYRFFTLPWAGWASDGIKTGIAQVKS
ncbi:MAG: aldolase/citrate lyase family protein [Pseudomonadota bacterium]